MAWTLQNRNEIKSKLSKAKEKKGRKLGDVCNVFKAYIMTYYKAQISKARE